MKKVDRELVFNKYGGKCAYCGCDLTKGWHVDEVEPCIRKTKRIAGHWSHPDAHMMTEEEMQLNKVVWVNEKDIFDGYEFPERVHLDNQNPACASCNIMKNRNTLEGFRYQIAQFIPSLNLYINQYKFAKRYGLVVETQKLVVFYFEQIEQLKSA